MNRMVGSCRLGPGVIDDVSGIVKGSVGNAFSKADDLRLAGCVEVGVAPNALAARLLVIMAEVLLGSGRAEVVEVDVG